MSAASTDYFTKIAQPGAATSLAAPGHTIAGTSINVDSTTLWPTTTGVIFAIDTVTIGAGGVEVRDANSYTVWEGIVSSATTITSMVLLYGTDQNYPAGTTTRVYQLPTASRENKTVDGLLITHELTGLNKSGVLYPSPVFSGTTTGTYTLGGTVTLNSPTLTGTQPGWVTGLTVPNTVTALGNRSYSLVVNSTDLTGIVSAGMRLRTTRTVAAPTQCTNLNGTTQYWVKTTPNKLTFTDDFVVSAWVKLSSYNGTNQWIASRFNGTSGWGLLVTSTGQVQMSGFNANAANVSSVISYQSVPLNKWVHVAAQLDMSAFTATTTTSYVMIDGLDVPASVTRGGTNPTALVQAGNLEVGGESGGSQPFGGKIAQVAIYNAKVTQANILATISQGLAGTETSLASAYSFNNAVTDLNTTTPNDLSVGGGSAVATNADSPFGGQADGTISSTLEYAIVTKTAFSTNTTLTVQVAEGNAIPTTGGVSAVAYSTHKSPYGLPGQRGKWTLYSLSKLDSSQVSPTAGTWYHTSVGALELNTPVGEWLAKYQVNFGAFKGTTTAIQSSATLSTTNNSATDADLTSGTQVEGASGTISSYQSVSKEKPITQAAQATYYLNLKCDTVTSGALQLLGASYGTAVISMENAYL